MAHQHRQRGFWDKGGDDKSAHIKRREDKRCLTAEEALKIRDMQAGAGILAGAAGAASQQSKPPPDTGESGPTILGFVHRSLALVDEHAAKLVIAERAQRDMALDYITRTRLSAQEHTSASKPVEGKGDQRKIVRQHIETANALAEWWCGARMCNEEFAQVDLDDALQLGKYEDFYVTLLGALHDVENQRQDDLDLTLRSWANMDWHTDNTSSSSEIDKLAFEDSIFELADYCCLQPLEAEQVATFLRMLFELVFGKKSWYKRWREERLVKQAKQAAFRASQGGQDSEDVGGGRGNGGRGQYGDARYKGHLPATFSATFSPLANTNSSLRANQRINQRAAGRRHSVTTMGGSDTTGSEDAVGRRSGANVKAAGSGADGGLNGQQRKAGRAKTPRQQRKQCSVQLCCRKAVAKLPRRGAEEELRRRVHEDKSREGRLLHTESIPGEGGTAAAGAAGAAVMEDWEREELEMELEMEREIERRLKESKEKEEEQPPPMDLYEHLCEKHFPARRLQLQLEVQATLKTDECRRRLQQLTGGVGTMDISRVREVMAGGGGGSMDSGSKDGHQRSNGGGGMERGVQDRGMPGGDSGFSVSKADGYREIVSYPLSNTQVQPNQEQPTHQMQQPNQDDVSSAVAATGVEAIIAFAIAPDTDGTHNHVHTLRSLALMRRQEVWSRSNNLRTRTRQANAKLEAAKGSVRTTGRGPSVSAHHYGSQRLSTSKNLKHLGLGQAPYRGPEMAMVIRKTKSAASIGKHFVASSGGGGGGGGGEQLVLSIAQTGSHASSSAAPRVRPSTAHVSTRSGSGSGTHSTHSSSGTGRTADGCRSAGRMRRDTGRAKPRPATAAVMRPTTATRAMQRHKELRQRPGLHTTTVAISRNINDGRIDRGRPESAAASANANAVRFKVDIKRQRGRAGMALAAGGVGGYYRMLNRTPNRTAQTPGGYCNGHMRPRPATAGGVNGISNMSSIVRQRGQIRHGRESTGFSAGYSAHQQGTDGGNPVGGNPLPLGSGFVAGAVGGHRAVNLLLAEEDDQLMFGGGLEEGEEQEELVPDQELELGGMQRREEEGGGHMRGGHMGDGHMEGGNMSHDDMLDRLELATPFSASCMEGHGNALGSESMLSESILTAAADELGAAPPGYTCGSTEGAEESNGVAGLLSSSQQEVYRASGQRKGLASQIDAGSSCASETSNSTSIGALSPSQQKRTGAWASVSADAREFRRSRGQPPSREEGAIFRKPKKGDKKSRMLKKAPRGDDIVQAYATGFAGPPPLAAGVTVTHPHPPSHFPNQGTTKIKTEKIKTEKRVELGLAA
jgi:hypothetical protein